MTNENVQLKGIERERETERDGKWERKADGKHPMLK